MEKKQRKLIKPGEVWQLGNHRIVCGDAMDPETVKKAVGGGSIREILSDPPYGVNYVAGKADFAKLGNNTAIKGDQLQTDEEYADFTKKWLEAAVPHLSDYNTAYIFNSDMMLCALRKGMKGAGFYFTQMIIWVKNSPVMGMKDYLSQNELIAYGWKGHHKMERSKAKSVLFYPKPSRSKLHPTMKPVGLLRQMILNSTKIGELIYDPFGGSGSTLMACEHTRRKCAMIELEPEYVSTTIQRWEILTGQEAIKI